MSGTASVVRICYSKCWLPPKGPRSSLRHSHCRERTRALLSLMLRTCGTCTRELFHPQATLNYRTGLACRAEDHTRADTTIAY